VNNTSFKPSTKKVTSSPSNSLGEKNPLLQLAIDPAYTPLDETSQVTPNATYSATLSLTVSLPTTTTGMYLSNTFNFT